MSRVFFLSGHFDILQPKEARERYLKKLQSIDGHDPYEIGLTIWNLGLSTIGLHSFYNISAFQFESVLPKLVSNVTSVLPTAG